ncbi:YihY family inner membrane protein [Streptomyces sp. SID8379]|uniref:YihY/virulence factor BrkB family protein n=1 Tax=unclassified Streptomyces TaxID=2593676 RepID=UPI00037883BB|nr:MULTISPECIES: YihY/virulence factor BrkB family protein [unclassified Streptomyces]MYW66909.1 YihY family inner membrane protein [Streptomyces sp. SID8379]
MWDHKSTEDSAAKRGAKQNGPEDFGPTQEVERTAPDSPAELPTHAWIAVLKRSFREFQKDELVDRAAALTYYGVLSLFPALLVLVSLLGAAGEKVTQKLLDNFETLAPGPARDILTTTVTQLRGNAGIGSIMAVVGLVLTVWSASGYVGAFVRTANQIYDVPEGRPFWKVLPLRVGLTILLMVLALFSALIVVFTGAIARQAGDLLHLGDTALMIWTVVKWPVLAVLLVLMIALLYWATPNVKGRGWRWVTPGGFLALLVWLVASAGFTFYAAGFSSYNKTYGAMAGAIVFLVWLWLSNLAILLGLEFDAEMARQRAMAGGHPEQAEPFIEPRDTRAWDEEDEEEAKRTNGL